MHGGPFDYGWGVLIMGGGANQQKWAKIILTPGARM
jgi:hypothetical protein